MSRDEREAQHLESQDARRTPSMFVSALWNVAGQIDILRSAPRSSQAARRDQNRIAQREFRLRKQQRVRFIAITSTGHRIPKNTCLDTRLGGACRDFVGGEG